MTCSNGKVSPDMDQCDSCGMVKEALTPMLCHLAGAQDTLCGPENSMVPTAPSPLG